MLILCKYFLCGVCKKDALHHVINKATLYTEAT